MTSYKKELAAALEWMASTLAGPGAEPYPTLTPAIWREMRCRDGNACRCTICRWEEKHAPEVHWRLVNRPKLSQQLPTLDQLLTAWAERTFYRSAAGQLIDRGRDRAAPPERTNEPWAIRKADVALEVERSIRWAFSDPAHCHGLSIDACARILALSVQGADLDSIPGIDSETARAVVRDGRRYVLIDLAARGLVRMPKGVRDRVAVADRMTALSHARSTPKAKIKPGSSARKMAAELRDILEADHD